MGYQPKNPIRIVSAASLFDGHDAAINIMRRILQDMGAEVIHLGHNRSVSDVVHAALQEGAQGIAISSYQGGHMEYFKYMKDLLREAGADYVRIYGGGGGVIIHSEKKELEDYGIAQIFHPDDGRRLGLEGMIEMIVRECDFALADVAKPAQSHVWPQRELGLMIDAIENRRDAKIWLEQLADFKRKTERPPRILGITGTGGAGKSSLVDELVQRFLNFCPGVKIAVVCTDPTKSRTGGALLGDRIRMNSLSRDHVFMRSLASRHSGAEISAALPEVLTQLRELDFDLIIAESSGIGQSGHAITKVSDKSLYVMTADFGAQSQLEKIEMIDFADFIAINKADHRGSQDAYRDVQKQYRRSRKKFVDEGALPVFLTQASNFNDRGVNELFLALTEMLVQETKQQKFMLSPEVRKQLFGTEKQTIVPPDRQNYLAEIARTVREYKHQTEVSADAAAELGAIERFHLDKDADKVAARKSKLRTSLGDQNLALLKEFEALESSYNQPELEYGIRGRLIKQKMFIESLSGTPIPRVSFPKISDWGDRLRFMRLESVPGRFPFTAGVFPLKREDEDPTRQFAGEGPPEKTNRRFHFLSKNMPAKRLSTAFDSVTLYGHDPDLRPDIYGKVGESGVSIATLDDMKRLYEGFDLCDPTTSVSMTINGPAPMILAFYLNTAIDQQVAKAELTKGCRLSEVERNDVVAQTLKTVRGTVQADILKEDQGQNTCIFSIDFALKLMADVQEYFIKHEVRNFYSVSISGYHIAEAGANPITQLALTLSNAFTYVEYYLSRGMQVDDFAPNLSFFFSNGLDPEYTVIGRVARRIWAIAMRDRYQASERAQKLKYHIQTSGRSLHAQEIAFNDIRTTLQALIAVSDHCNSLHTNAYDEAITTPTEESVRRATAIQLIINKEFGLNKNENPLQGSYFVEWLTDVVEEAVLEEFNKISLRGGVLGAMETGYQRGKIQDESMHYEHLKHSGEFPVVGVNTYVDPKTIAKDYVPPKIELARATPEEKNMQLKRTLEFRATHAKESAIALAKIKDVALRGENVFAELMQASRVCSLFEMTRALFDVGGQYRRNV